MDACLYFLPPHRLRKMDVAFMRALAPLVPVIPILAKADTMTSEELKVRGRGGERRTGSTT